MLVKIIKYLFEKDYDNQYDLPLPFTFIGLNLINKVSRLLISKTKVLILKSNLYHGIVSIV
jgi:hypothetical protein